jgi:hypothetical protein
MTFRKRHDPKESPYWLSPWFVFGTPLALVLQIREARLVALRLK